MTPEGREAIWGPREPAAAPGPRHSSRRHRVMPMGGIGQPCGCRHTRTADGWLHVTPCRSHPLRPYPITDENFMELTSA